MKKLWISLLSVAAAVPILAFSQSASQSADAPVAVYAQEVQGWRTEDDHIHSSFAAPMLGKLDSTITVPVTTLLHNRSGGTLTFVRWGDESNIHQNFSYSIVGDGSSEQKVTTNITMDPSKFSRSGWREIRLSSNFITSTGGREFTTTRVCIFVVNSNSRSDYCNKGEPGSTPPAAGRCGGGAWYEDTEYSVVFVDCRDVWKAQTSPLKAGDVIRVKGQSGTGRVYVNLDPAFHSGNPGTPLVVDQPSGTTINVVIPSGITPGAHKLHIRNQRDNGEAGVYVLNFTVAGTTTTTTTTTTVPPTTTTQPPTTTTTVPPTTTTTVPPTTTTTRPACVV